MLNKIKKVVYEAGNIILKAKDIEYNEKSGYRDIVTQYDVAVQDYLFEALHSIDPMADMIGEEGKNDFSSLNRCFIVDPIDGTTNFRFGLKKSAISVAYVINGEVQIGCVYDPYTNEMFYAKRGEGAYCNGQALCPINNSLKSGLIIFGTNPYHSDYLDETFDIAKKCFLESMDIRRLGAASLDICYVAAGRAVLFYEGVLSPWDFAAAKLIAEEVNLSVKTWEGFPLSLNKKSSLVVGNARALSEWFMIRNSI